MTNKFHVDQLRQEIDRLVLNYPDLTEDERLRSDMLEGVTSMPEVLETLLGEQRANETMIDALEHRMDDLVHRRTRLKHRVDVLRDLMLKILQSADLKKIELPEATLSQRNSPPQIVGNLNADELPDNLCRIKREPDRTKIREALLKGDLVPGVVLSNSPPTLTISTK